MLPRAIAKELDRVKLRKVSVISRIGTWEMKIQRNASDGRLYLGDGWTEFSNAHVLTDWHLIQFRSLGDMILQASIMKCNGEEEMGFIFQAESKEKISTVVPCTSPPAPMGGETSCEASRTGKVIIIII